MRAVFAMIQELLMNMLTTAEGLGNAAHRLTVRFPTLKKATVSADDLARFVAVGSQNA